MSLPTPEELVKAGAHIGHRKSKWNPRMAPYVFGVRNNFHIIDVFKTIEALTAAIEFLKETIRSGGNILFVGTTIQTRTFARETAQAISQPFIAERWIGGLFTNFRVVRERIRHFRDLREKRETGELEKYTKKERLQFERELDKLERELGGIHLLEKLPNALFISDVEREKTAALEAKKMGIPVVAIVDTDGDPSIIDYPIPANDSSRASLELIYGALRDELTGITPRPADKPVPTADKQ